MIELKPGQVGARDAQPDHDRDRDEGHARREHPQIGRQLQGQMGEGGDRVEREAQHPPQRVLGLAGVPGLAFVLDGALGEPDPHGHAAQEARALGHRQERVQRPPVEQPEIARVGLEVDLGELVEEPVEPGRRRQLEGRLALALARVRRRPRLSPRATRSSIVSISSGGSCRSASIIATTSPTACSRPAVRAA